MIRQVLWHRQGYIPLIADESVDAYTNAYNADAVQIDVAIRPADTKLNLDRLAIAIAITNGLRGVAE